MQWFAVYLFVDVFPSFQLVHTFICLNYMCVYFIISGENFSFVTAYFSIVCYSSVAFL